MAREERPSQGSDRSPVWGLKLITTVIQEQRPKLAVAIFGHYKEPVLEMFRALFFRPDLLRVPKGQKCFLPHLTITGALNGFVWALLTPTWKLYPPLGLHTRSWVRRTALDDQHFEFPIYRTIPVNDRADIVCQHMPTPLLSTYYYTTLTYLLSTSLKSSAYGLLLNHISLELVYASSCHSLCAYGNQILEIFSKV